ncbi:MAG: DUF3341 domain-containing protein [Phycisphaerae bacterium]|nr:DUF3341 domain-containing protein [Phycisphaerae bacterium]
MDNVAVKPIGVVGLFDSPDALLGAARRFREAGARRWDCHTPYPVHGLDDAMGLKPTRLAWVTIPAAFLGLLAAVALTGGLSVIQYPIRIGGKPLFSWQAFVPIFFELFVLFACVSTMIAIIVFCRLGRWHSPLHDSDVMKHITCDRFAVAVQTGGEGEMSDADVRRILEQCGCSEIRPLVECEE